MRGYVVKKGKRYYAVVYEGTDPGTGKERRRWIAAGPRRKDAEALVAQMAAQVRQGDDVAPARSTLAEYLVDRWLPLQESRLRPTSYNSYRATVELHIVPHIGRIRLDRLQPDDLEQLYVRLLRQGRRNGNKKGLERDIGSLRPPSTAQGPLRRPPKGVVARNVATIADPPAPPAKGAKGAINVWDAETLGRFLSLTAEHELHCLWFVAAKTGMRRGELLGLRWRDVDLDKATISVRHAVVTSAYKVHESDVKTSSGRRTIDLGASAVDALTTHRSWASGKAGDLVFRWKDGREIHPERVSRTFDRLVIKHNLPRIRLHDVRHTHATLLLKAGVPAKVVSERLGHASPGFTLNVYQHVLPGMQAEAAKIFDELTRE